MSPFPFHIAATHGKKILLLRKSEHTFRWSITDSHFEQETFTQICGSTFTEALAKGRHIWKEEQFRLIHCGFRYTLPERDQVGSNALFWQMALSYNAPNGRYFDEEVGHLCYVDFASHEALELWRKIKASAVTSA